MIARETARLTASRRWRTITAAGVLLLAAAILVVACSGLITWAAAPSRWPFWTGALVAGLLLLGAVTNLVNPKERD